MIFHPLRSESADLIIVDLLIDLPAVFEEFLFSLYAPKALYLGKEAVISFVYERFKYFELEF